MSLLQRISAGFRSLAHGFDSIGFRGGRKRRWATLERADPLPTLAMGTFMCFRDNEGAVIASIWPDGTTEVYQPDKIRECGGALVEHLAAAAARDAAEKEFGGAP